MLSAEEMELIEDYGVSRNWEVVFTADSRAVINLPGFCSITLYSENSGTYILNGSKGVFNNFPIGIIQIDKEKYRVRLELIDILESIAQSIPAKQEQAENKGANTLSDYWDEISQLEEAERAQWTKSRVGQDKLRNYLLKIHGGCQITGINRKELLIASHIKPWRDCADKKREGLDPENILLLAKNYDAFFDAALISFSPNDGSLIVSPLVTESDLDLMGIRRDAKLSSPSFKQAEYLKWHNELLRKRKN